MLFDAPGGGERTRASLALDNAGDGMGILLGLESPFTADRSVVAVTGMTPAAVAAAVAALRAPGELGQHPGGCHAGAGRADHGVPHVCRI